MMYRNEKKTGKPFRIAALLLIALTAACAERHRPPEADPPWLLPQQKAVPAPQVAATPEPATRPAPVASKPEAPVAVTPVVPPVAVSSPVVTEPIAPRAEAAAEKPAVVVKPELPAEKPAAKAAAPKQPAAPAPKPSTLDLASLEQRLKDTSAIGVFTKLTLKNQVDDLVNQFRAHYQGRSKTNLTALRQPYEQLLLKVLALLQDGDPPLARAVAESREAIWGILSDPEKFKNL